MNEKLVAVSVLPQRDGRAVVQYLMRRGQKLVTLTGEYSFDRVQVEWADGDVLVTLGKDVPEARAWQDVDRILPGAAAASSVATPTPPGVTTFDGTAGTTATESEPAHAIGAQRGTGQTADDRALLAGGPPGPAVQSHTT